MGNQNNDLRQELDKCKYIIENIRDIIWEMDQNMVITFISPADKVLRGYEPEEVIGRSLYDFLTEESRDYIADARTSFLKKYKPGVHQTIYMHDIQMFCKDGRIIWVEISANVKLENNEFAGFIGSTRDVTEKKLLNEQLKEYIIDLEKLATIDLLTGAYNRRKFDETFKFAAENRKRYDRPFSMILFDIDFFKKINDTYGHRVGDKVLSDLSNLILKQIRKTDSFFRWGGEEFMILLFEIGLEEAVITAEKLRVLIQNNDFGIGSNITISLGVAEYKKTESMDQFIIRLDDSLLLAKKLGRNTIEITY